MLARYPNGKAESEHRMNATGPAPQPAAEELRRRAEKRRRCAWYFGPMLDHLMIDPEFDDVYDDVLSGYFAASIGVK